MKVGVVGIGHVGLPTASVLAHIGHEVTAIDSDRQKLEALRAGDLPYFEPGLAELVDEGRANGRLKFVTDFEDLVAGAEVVFVCVGTPPRSSGGANLLAVEKAARAVAEVADGRVVVAEKSTVPAGTAERVARTLDRYRRSAEFLVVSNPEFLREGSAVNDSLTPDRILVGAESPEALEVMKRLYSPLIEKGARWIATDLRTAELAKHACNAFLALKVSYINALARICELSSADVTDVAEIMGSDPRIGPAFLDAGIGYGGYCFPKDLAAFDRLARQLGYEFPLLGEIARINDEALQAAFDKIETALWNLEEKRVALLGLSFKPGTSDTRLSPSLELARKLIAAGATVCGYDPAAGSVAASEVDGIEVVDDLYEVFKGADCAVICTAWDEFKTIDLARARQAMAIPILVDGRNLLDGGAVAAQGFTYIPTGRSGLEPDPTAR
ncbi:MAG: nucleotide sugar dehydrogenase [Actinobacteria bacterium]|nr:nucleotide sugar dehydrogenase [Actinomycetota bacterium]